MCKYTTNEYCIYLYHMRIWSLHPQHLDTKGLVAPWRETLLAKHVLEGKTKGYTNHPQLNRFKEEKQPLDCINFYLAKIYDEACARGYNFDKSKFQSIAKNPSLKVTQAQVNYEWKQLLKKLKERDTERYSTTKKNGASQCSPAF